MTAGRHDALVAQRAQATPREAAAWNARMGRDVGKRPQHECALMHARVRQRHADAVHATTAV